MRRGRIFFYLAFILLLGLVAVALIYTRYLKPSQSQTAGETPAAVDVVNVLVVTQPVERGSAITGDVLGMVPIPRELFIQGMMFTNVSEVEGRLAKFDLDTGIPLTSGMVVASAEELSGSGSNIALSIPRGMVAVSIPVVNLSGVSFPPQPGDHVNILTTLEFVDLDLDFQSKLPNQVADVIASGASGGENLINYLTARVAAGGYMGVSTMGKGETIAGLGQSVYSVPSEAQRSRQVSQNLVQDAVILTVGNFYSIMSGQNQATGSTQPSAGPPPAEGEATPPPPPQVDFISVVVTPQDAIAINYLVHYGAKLTLALRAAEDDTRVKTEAVTLQFLLNQYNVPVPVKLQYSLEQRGDEVGPPSVQIPQPTAPPE